MLSPFLVGLCVSFSQPSLNAQLPRATATAGVQNKLPAPSGGVFSFRKWFVCVWNRADRVCVICLDLNTLVQPFCRHTHQLQPRYPLAGFFLLAGLADLGLIPRLGPF